MDNKINSSAALWNAANEQLTEKIHSQDIGNLVHELKRVHMKSDELYVYCSDNDIKLIERVLADYPFKLNFNVTDLMYRTLSGKRINNTV